MLLCEDQQTDSFVRHFLSKRNFNAHDIHTLPLPKGRQSGEQWVRTSFPNELKIIRTRHNAFLIVIIDADSFTTDDRRNQLNRECREQGVPEPSPDDPVIIAVPRRNIETWFAYLDGEAVDETGRYPRLTRASNCRHHARELYRMCHEVQQLRPPVPQSLSEACGEYRKLTR